MQAKPLYAVSNPCLAAPMIVLVTGLFGWSWYVHVVVMEVNLFEDGALGLAIPDAVLW
jgi:hypothetical protein